MATGDIALGLGAFGLALHGLDGGAILLGAAGLHQAASGLCMKLAAETLKKERGREPAFASTGLALPLRIAAESAKAREELRWVWQRALVNALDPDFKDPELRHSDVEAITALNPSDVVLIVAKADPSRLLERRWASSRTGKETSEMLNLDVSSWTAQQRHLIEQARPLLTNGRPLQIIKEVAGVLMGGSVGISEEALVYALRDRGVTEGAQERDSLFTAKVVRSFKEAWGALGSTNISSATARAVSERLHGPFVAYELTEQAQRIAKLVASPNQEGVK